VSCKSGRGRLGNKRGKQRSGVVAPDFARETLLRLRTLKNRAEFARVKNGGKWSAKSFVLLAVLRDGSGEADNARCLSDRAEQTTPRCSSDHTIQAGARFGFTVASRSLIDKNEGTKRQPPKRPGAVMRNRARRRLKEAVRLLAPVYARPEYDYVIIGRREALHQAFSDLLEDLRTAFGKVHRPPRGQGKARPRQGSESVKAEAGKMDTASGGKGADTADSSCGKTGSGTSCNKG
jgi:ribonuclease P protein component